jgi:ribosomal protein L21E
MYVFCKESKQTKKEHGQINMETTMEEFQLTGQANQLIENNLSSVKISHNSKGTTWEIKVKNENAYRCMVVANKINDELETKYNGK